MTTSYSHQEGYKNSAGTTLAFEGLASSDYQTIPISVDAASRDWGNPDGSTHLRPYLAMGYDTSCLRYAPFNNVLHAEATLVVLAEELRDMDTVTTACNSVGFYKATFKGSVIVETTAVTWSEVQRISVRDNA